MKELILILLLSSAPVLGFSQLPIALFDEVDESIKAELDLGLIDEYTLLQINTEKWNQIKAERPESIQIEIPFGDESLKLNLDETDLFKTDLVVRSASGLSLDYRTESRSVFYQGVFEAHGYSHFALSVLNNEIIGVGSIPGLGDMNLGKLPGEDYYILYAESALDGQNTFECNTDQELPDKPNLSSDDRAVVEDCSGLYFEVDYDIFLAKGSVIASADYMMALFNEIQFLYELDGMTVFISDLMVWDEVSPYYLESDTGILLDLFGVTTTVWDGDLGHLVTNSASGGLAWVGVFCSPDQAIRKAVSGISLTFEEVPVYSWSVEVIAHELGHNMGSPHTHACFWNDDLTAIDGCGPEAGFDEGCAEDLPADGGTVMSYCHLTAVGINLAFGFGEQPGTLLRNNIIAAGCLESCDLQVMDVQVLGGDITATCENSPVFREIYVVNNGNENMTFLTAKVYVDAVLTETILWTGLILEGEEGVVNLPSFSLPLGSYNMTIELELPDGYEDEDMSDNSITFSFDVTPFPVASFYPEDDQMVSYNATTRLVNETSGAVGYEWDMGDGTTGITEISPQHTFPFEYGGYYTITLFATSVHGCIDTTYGNVNVEGVNIFYIPNSFTPDGDTYNDEFKPIFTANLDVYDYHLTVFNRYGEIMFESYNAAAGWDGTYGNKGRVQDGVYIWTLEFGDLSSDKKHHADGHVTLIK